MRCGEIWHADKTSFNTIDLVTPHVDSTHNSLLRNTLLKATFADHSDDRHGHTTTVLGVVSSINPLSNNDQQSDSQIASHAMNTTNNKPISRSCKGKEGNKALCKKPFRFNAYPYEKHKLLSESVKKRSKSRQSKELKQPETRKISKNSKREARN